MPRPIFFPLHSFDRAARGGENNLLDPASGGSIDGSGEAAVMSGELLVIQNKGVAGANPEKVRLKLCLASWQNCRKSANYVFKDN